MPISVPNPNQVYNPRDHSPIRLPEVETCITCGQQLPSKTKLMTNDMSQYLNGDDMKGVIVVPSIEDTLEIKGVTFYRIKGRDHKGEPILATPPSKPVQTPVVTGIQSTPPTT